MNKIFLLLSLLALLISAIWSYQTNFDYEPIIVFIMGLAGIVLHFFTNGKKQLKPSTSNNANQSNTQKIKLNINLPPDSYTKEEQKNSAGPLSESREAKLELRKTKTNILFIDDDKNFKVVKILKDSGWKNTKSITDLKHMSLPILKETDIFFVDINGVGKSLDLPNEGLDIALMLKQKYPQKKVVIYSANKNNNIFHEAWDCCDFKLEKNALPYQFQSLVEQYSLEIK